MHTCVFFCCAEVTHSSVTCGRWYPQYIKRKVPEAKSFQNSKLHTATTPPLSSSQPVVHCIFVSPPVLLLVFQ